MTQNEECRDLLMDDVVRIDIMPMTALKVSVPFGVQNITEAVVKMSDNSALTDEGLFGGSLLSVSMTGDGRTDAILGDGTTHKVSEKRDVAGIVRTHTLQVPIDVGFLTVRERQKALQQTDFHIILTTYDGTRYLAYALPNTCQFTIDDQMGETAQMTVKASVQSMSGFIRISA